MAVPEGADQLRVRPAAPLRGRVSVPGDKSISHRGLIFGALASGRSRLTGLLDAEDIGATRKALLALGARIDGPVPGAGGRAAWLVWGSGGFVREPEDVLDCGNSGTTLRLLTGLLAGQPELFAVLTGDASLRGRPQRHLVEPLRALGASIVGRRGGDRAPLVVAGGRPLRAGHTALPTASAQVLTAILLGSLQTEGQVSVELPGPARDHSERMLRAMGAAMHVEETAAGGRRVEMTGGPRLVALDLDVPGDPSSAAFLVVAATLVPGSDLEIADLGLNPTRTGFLDVLRRMGAEIAVEEDIGGFEPHGRLRVRHAPLRGTRVRRVELPRLLDEVPILAVAAALAEGETVFADMPELRGKESDRIASTVALLRGFRVEVEELAHGFVVHGTGGRPLRGAWFESRHDHRLAMSATVAGLVATGETRISGAGCIATSYPGFVATLAALSEGSVS